MARARASTLSVKKKRLELPVAKKPRFESLGDGLSLGYRRNKSAGTWVARKADGRGGSSQRVIGFADDYQDADGETVFSWAQAQAKAFALDSASSAKPQPGHAVTVREAVERYERDLRLRGADPGNVARIRYRLPDHLQDRRVIELRKGELRAWRDSLLDVLRPASVNRTCNALRAALNLAGDQHEQITNRNAWEKDLAALPDASVARNVILSDDVVRSIVAAAYDVNDSFGLLIETAAVTGARYSQLMRLRVSDLQGEGSSVRLLMPSSRKGRGIKKVQRRPVPIPPSLANKLQRAAADRQGEQALLAKYNGEPWRKSDHTRLFARAVREAGLDEVKLVPHSSGDLTLYALRHTNIARQILRGVPIRMVAVMHDTSVAMIEKNYSALLADHADSITRAALFDIKVEPAEAIQQRV